MNVTTITMPKAEAQRKLDAYQAQLCRRIDAEYEAAAAGYQALAEGTPLINLPEVIQAGGFDEKMRPKLAVARADRKQVKFEWQSGRQIASFDTNKGRSRDWLTMVIDVAMGRERGKTVKGYALIPMVPADVRASVAGQLKDYVILWEVEQWADQRIKAIPDKDPFLLRHLGGDLYAVVAEWDLTDLERMVMAGRRDG